ncbi:P-loop containing nucleoside triphosphate hydrolase protein [Lasiosphaeris hirsuta]|uniref:P-loop containing nucleoside triphosphate hydrolase protein n=1 Tax=Lasiosphaeris hirsuta TaxID=260670 RepID=A0AA40E323_9PEZI|nr:P-loop containing nucleoside triphosphate hydrolase protein [Lasiosphaeris hirsuta]
MATTTVEISDDDDQTASSPAIVSITRTPNTRRKRKPSPAFRDKVVWTDDDSEDAEKLNPRNPSKRRATEKGKSKADQKTAGRGRPSKKTSPKDDHVFKIPTRDNNPEALIPEYLRLRRGRFDRDRLRLRDAGLKLPPDYSDILFSDDERVAKQEERPKFSIKPSRPYKEIELEHSAGIVPASIAQYLRDYQIVGVKFLHRHFVYQKGCILGDDMGLGKTVQVAAFLAATFGKTGDKRDIKRMRKMRRAEDLMSQPQSQGQTSFWYPKILIVCPGSLIQNWKNELNRWGWWHVDTYHGAGKDDVLRAAKAGRIEVMITTYTTYKNMHEAVNEVEWDCVVADECHALKDRRSETTQAMDRINSLCRIGLTGTAIQNKYEELWTLLNWTNPGHFGTLSEWTHTITKPLTLGQSHDATLKQLSIARTTAKKLVQNLLPKFFLRRMKTLIADQLPKKSDKVVFCPLSDIQREAYENFLQGSQVSFINTVHEKCSCGSGAKRGWCCYKELPDGRPWKTIIFPTILSLQKLANHLTLLIPPSGEANVKKYEEKRKAALKVLQTCLPDGWEELYKNRDSMLTLSNPEYCGKWNVLRKLLRFWHESGDKVLVFSHSVRLLRILQHLFQSTSYNVSFLDGRDSYEDRQRVVDDFNSDPAQFVFLISTKAGGVGLNITSANKVVIFDPHWNPSYDLQAQDRAYRIGQVRDVDVFRLVSAGTIEEIVYARQIYKQQQANIGYSASNERRYFKGVQRDSNRKGEIFGLANLFSYRVDQVVLREIVNKTNIAEAKAGVSLTDIDIENHEHDGDALAPIKQEDKEDDVGLSSLAKVLTAENQEEELMRIAGKAGSPAAGSSKKPKSDAIAAILASAGVEYSHENSEVIGTSRIEAQLSRRAEMVAERGDTTASQDAEALFADEASLGDVDGDGGPLRMHYRFNPPEDVMRRQFCEMARQFGFSNATDFALVVESWTQEQRRNCLDGFYRAREVQLLERALAEVKEEDKQGGGMSGVNGADATSSVALWAHKVHVTARLSAHKSEAAGGNGS